MTIALDGSSPTSFDLTGDGAGGASGTSASFTPPANAWIYIGIAIAVGTSRTPVYTPTNTGGGLSSWTLVDSLGSSGTQGGAVGVYRAFVNSSVATTVSVSLTNTGLSLSAVCGHVYTDVWTGAGPSQTGAAFTDAHSTTQNISPTLTTTVSGSQVSSIFNDESANGNPTSTDTLNGRTSASQSDARIYKASNSGAPGSVAVNANGAGAGTQWSYILYEILASGGGGGTTSASQVSRPGSPSLAAPTNFLQFQKLVVATPFSPNVTLGLNGQAATFTPGALGANASVPLTGQAATFTAGTMTKGLSLSMTGQAASFGAGILGPVTSLLLGGQVATFAAGTLTASGGGSDVTVSLTGQASTFTVGQMAAGTTLGLLGQAATFTPGQMTLGMTVSLTGTAATFTAGRMIPSGGTPIFGPQVTIVGFIANTGSLMGH